MPAFLKRHHRVFLVAVAAMGLLAAWWRYPADNKFSLLSCTISFLGSPDANRNPQGWRFYQAGMTTLVVLLASLVMERHLRLRRQIGKAALCSTALFFVFLGMLMVVTWIPDSREQVWFGVRAGDLHTRTAILAIPFLVFGVIMDGVTLWWSGVRLRALWPFHLFGLIVLVAMAKLMAWERMCRQDPALVRWPGDGLYSTPLWEWVVFSYFVGFMAWMACGKFQSEDARPQG